MIVVIHPLVILSLMSRSNEHMIQRRLYSLLIIKVADTLVNLLTITVRLLYLFYIDGDSQHFTYRLESFGFRSCTNVRYHDLPNSTQIHPKSKSTQIYPNPNPPKVTQIYPYPNQSNPVRLG